MSNSAYRKIGIVLLLTILYQFGSGTVDVRAGENSSALGREAYKFLNLYCSECHHGDEPFSGVDDFDVLDYKSLTKKRMRNGKVDYYVRPGTKGADSLKHSRVWFWAGVEGVAGALGEMPPDYASRHPTDKKRAAVLQKWLEAGAPAWPEPMNVEQVVSKPGELERQLWIDVRAIFEERCMKCHDGADPTSGVKILQVMDYKSLTHKWTKMDRAGRLTKWDQDPWYYVPTDGKGKEQLEKSLLWYMVINDLMPRGGELTAGQKTILKVWIMAGAPVPPAPKRRPFLSQKAQRLAIVKHLQSKEAKDRPYQRYFSFANLHNNRNIYEADLRTYRAALAKLVNSLSWQKTLVMPTEVPETHKAVFAVDVRDLGWDKNKFWSDLEKTYPYVMNKDTDEATLLKRLSGSPLPVVRADWFVTMASRPPLYHRALELPESAAELEKRLGINFVDNFLKNKMVRAGYLGASTTTSGFRVVERQEIAKYKGAYWKSYDFGSELDRGMPSLRNPLVHNLGPVFAENPFKKLAFLHDGSEIIFNLPNGMQGYLVTDEKGNRANAPPIGVLKDKNEFSGSPQLVNGISCMACHSKGMQLVTDQIRAQALNKKVAFKDVDARNKILALYAEKKIMDDCLKNDGDVFMDALSEITTPFLTDPQGRVTNHGREMIYATTLRYRQHITLEEAACETDYSSVDMLRAKLLESPTLLLGLGIQDRLLKDGGKISREEWMQVFDIVVERLKKE